jgi:SGNH hydrolase-like domain, acetyltransferase AlgX
MRQFGLWLVLTGFTALACFLAAEVAVRVAARFLPAVQYLANAGRRGPPAIYRTLEDFLAANPAELVSHRAWFGHWNNALGFNDAEFVAPKPPGRLRIMALGDSFAYGMVPYPDNVLTIAEEVLRAACRNHDLDLLNFGINGAGVWQYKTLFELARPIYEPDIVAVHFYMGNDGPDVYTLRNLPSGGIHSYLWTFATSLWKVRRALDLAPSAPVGGPTAGAVGGERVGPGPRLTDDHPLMSTPTFSPEAFIGIARDELMHLYAPRRDPGRVARAWAPILDVLDTIRQEAARHRIRMIIVLFPSALQVYPTRRAEVLDALPARGTHADVSDADIDPTMPYQVVRAYCDRAGIDCFDVTRALLVASRESDLPLYRPRETHWNIRGNRVAAEATAAFLRAFVCPTGSAQDTPGTGWANDAGPLHAEGRDLGTKLRKTGSRDLEIKPAEEDARGGL